MKYLVMAALAALVFSGCGDIEGDVLNSNNTVDNSVDNSVSYVCTDNNSTNCYTPGREGFIDDEGNYNDVSDVVIGDYDPSYDQRECAAAGFFWCSIKNKCLNIPARTGTCNR